MAARLAKLGAWKACNFTSFSTVFQSYQDNGRVAGCFGPVFSDLGFIFGPVPFHLGGFGPIFRGELFWPNFVGSFWPTLSFNNFLVMKSIFSFPDLFPTCCYRHLQFL